MAKIIKKYVNLNVSQPNNYEICNIMQGTIDTVEIYMTLYDGNEPYYVDTTIYTSAAMIGGNDYNTVASGNVKAADAVPAEKGTNVNIYKFTISENIARNHGDFVLSLMLYSYDSEGKVNTVLPTFPFILRITDTPISTIGTDDISLFNDILNEAKELEEKAELLDGDIEAAKILLNSAITAANNAKTSETNAATSETNAKDYAEAASVSAENAATSATNAATSETNASNSEDAATTAKGAAETAQTKAEEALAQFKDYIIYSSTEPETQDTGDVWYEIIS